VSERIRLYDTTLRDGAQTQGVAFGAADKVAIAEALDRLGIDYVEGGWPGANPTDDAFFAAPPTLRHARLAAFGMTRRPGRSAENDPGLAAVLGARAPVATLVAKSWGYQVETALGTTLPDNLAMIRDSIALAERRVAEVMLDAEHFFDGYKDDPEYALACLEAAHESGAAWLVLCDTNGGTLPHEIEAIVAAVRERLPEARIGIHCHNDSDTAVAGSLAAVRAGARQVQGTLNGLGERCGNANLLSVIANLVLKMGFEAGNGRDGLVHLTHTARLLDERLNRPGDRTAAFVGESAFAHKGGLHVSAVARDPRTYEHVPPEAVGNARHIVVSDQSGRANLLARFREIGLDVAPDHPRIPRLIETVKAREHDGFAYDGAEASFELLARRSLYGVAEFFRLDGFRVLVERRNLPDGTIEDLAEATMKVVVGGRRIMTVAEGIGPVDALASALRQALLEVYDPLADMRLVDYKVRILTPEAGTAAVTRVMVESADGEGRRWSTVGVSANVLDASYDALDDAITYKLVRDGVAASDGRGRNG